MKNGRDGQTARKCSTVQDKIVMCCVCMVCDYITLSFHCLLILFLR